MTKSNIIWLAGLAVFAQQPAEELAARKIYLEDAGSPAAKGPTRPTTSPIPKPVPNYGANAGTKNSTTNTPRPTPQPQPQPQPKDSGPFVPAGNGEEKKVVDVRPYLAVRYNVLECDENGKPLREVDPDTEFRAGQKVRIRFAPSRSGYLYVFARQSNGEWVPLLPSLMFPEEPNAVKARSNKLVPEAPGLTFEFSGPAGEDRLLLVVSESNEDLYELNNLIRGKQKLENQTPAAKPLPTNPNQTPEVILANHVTSSVEQLVGEMAGRDLKIARVAKPEGNEPPHSVYVAQAGGPADRYILEIKLKHK